MPGDSGEGGLEPHKTDLQGPKWRGYQNKGERKRGVAQ